MRRFPRIGAIPEGYAAYEAEAVEYAAVPQQVLGELIVQETVIENTDEQYPES